MEPTENQGRSAFSDIAQTAKAAGSYIKAKKPTLASVANSAISTLSSPEFGSYGKKLQTADDVASYYGRKAIKFVSGAKKAFSDIRKIKDANAEDEQTPIKNNVIPFKNKPLEQKRTMKTESMLTFKQFVESLEYILEQKYAVDAADALSVARDPKAHPISRIWAGRHLTKANGHSDEDIAHHIRDMVGGDAHMKIAAILHPHAEEHLSSEKIEELKNHPNKKVSAAAQKRWGSGSSSAPAPVKTLPKVQKETKAGTKVQKPKAEKVAKKPAAVKPSSGISVVHGNPEDHGLPDTAKISHVNRNGKPIATAISTVRPAFGELDRDTMVHQAFVGDHTKEDGLKHVGNHGSHQEALIAAAKATKK